MKGSNPFLGETITTTVNGRETTVFIFGRQGENLLGIEKVPGKSFSTASKTYKIPVKQVEAQLPVRA